MYTHLEKTMLILFNIQDGQLGLGDTINRYSPNLITNLKNIIQISAGAYHSLALNNNGDVFSFGRNNV